MKKPISFILILCMVLAMMPMMSITASAAEPGTLYIGATLVSLPGDGSTTYENGSESGSTWWVSNSGGTYTLTLNNANIATSSGITTNAAIYSDGDLNIELQGNNTVVGQNGLSNCYGIYVNGATNISGSGVLSTTGGSAGGNNSYGLYVNGALNLSGSASITAAGGEGFFSKGVVAIGELNISGNGSLTATGSAVHTNHSWAVEAAGGFVISENGCLNATGQSAAGTSFGLYVGFGGNVNISGGTVNATAGTATGTSIGISSYGTLTISGGTVNATAGTATVHSYGLYAPGGSGRVNISGGTVDATGGPATVNSIGIYAEFGKVTISGGTVDATGGTATGDSKGISSNGELSISDGTVNATGGTSSSESLGLHGWGVTISGGAVTAKTTETTATAQAINPKDMTVSLGPRSVVTASTNGNGSGPVAYNLANITSYKYLKVEFAEVKPAAVIDYENEKLTGLTPSAVYTVNGADKTASSTGAIAIKNSWFGNTISLVKKGVGTTINSTVQSIALAARPATPTCTAIQPTASSATGTVSGISATMEYSTDGGSSWTDGTGSDVSGIAPGTVLIRVKATGSAPASLNQTITITAYSAPPSGGSGSGGGGSKTAATVTKIGSGESVASANVDNLVKEGKPLTVEGKAGEKLIFDTEALKTIVGQTKDSVKVEIKDVSTDHKSEQPGRLVVSLTITAGGKHITSFGNGTATVSLPYELKAGEKAEDVTVWYLAEDGKMTEVPCTYDPATKLATFKVNHFSLYVVGTADTSKWTNPYSDVKETSWFYDAVRYVSANGMMQGTKDTAFSPNGKTTRAMIVTILWRMENEPKTAKEITFTDVKNGKYYHDAVAWASEKGIVGGYSAERFAPEDNITREQLAVILHNYAALKGYKPEASGDLTTFSDSGKVHTWSKDAMSWANKEGLINGTGSNLLDPLGAAERCQVAAILQRFVENVAK